MPRRSLNSRLRASRGKTVLYSRTVLCTLTGASERQLALWEHEDLIAPARIAEIDGRSEPLYDRGAFERIRLIRTLTEELEVNLPGIGVILHLLDRERR